MKQETLKHVTLPEFIKTFRAFIGESGNQEAAATRLGISIPLLQKVLDGTRRPGPKMLGYFGLKTDRVLVRSNHQLTDRTGNE